MTVQEMHYSVQQGLQRAGSYDHGDLLGEEIDLQLNRAITRFVKERMDISTTDPLGFEQTQKRLDDIQTLLREHQYNNVLTDISNVDNLSPYTDPDTGDYVPGVIWDQSPEYYQISLPTDYWFTLRIEATVRRSSACVDEQSNPTDQFKAPVRIVRNNQLTQMMSHAYGTTRADSPIAVIQNGVAKIYTDGVFVVDELEFEYIREPAKVEYQASYVTGGTNTVDCDLPEQSHDEIVDIAVKYLSAVMQTPNYEQLTAERMQQE